MGIRASDSGLRLANMAFALALASDGSEGEGGASSAPEWMQIFPAPGVDGVVRARPGDDREWTLSNAAAVIANHDSRQTALMLDYDHQSERRNSYAAVAIKAAGWISAGGIVEREDGSVWAKPEYTPAAAKAIADREYRYVSPAFMHDSDGNIVALSSIALVNDPAFRMQALAARQDNSQPEGGSGVDEMKITTAMLSKLGLEDGATPEEVDAAITALAAREAAPAVPAAPAAPAPATEMAPAADLALAHKNHAEAEARATAAEEKVALAEAETFGRDVDTVLDASEANKKTAPESRDYHRATCFRDGKPYAAGLEALRKHVKVAAPVVGDSLGLASKKPPAGDAPAVSSSLASMAKNCGVTVEELEASGQDIAARTAV